MTVVKIKILLKNKKYWTHHKGKSQNDVSKFLFYEFAFAVLIEEINILLILPESLLNFV